jgi:hypothetical protein
MTLLSDFYIAESREALREGNLVPSWSTTNTDALHLAVLAGALTGQAWHTFLAEIDEQPLHKDDDSESVARVPVALTAALAALDADALLALARCLNAREEWAGPHPADTAASLRALRALCQEAAQENHTLYLVTRL